MLIGNMTATFVAHALGMTTRQLIHVVEQMGYRWDKKRGHGSHRVYVHPTRPHIVIPVHALGRDIGPRLAKAILRKAGLK